MLSAEVVRWSSSESRRSTPPTTAAIVRSSDYFWLEPPRDRGPITVADVLAGSATGKDWTRAVWSVLADHHAYVREWAAQLALSG